MEAFESFVALAMEAEGLVVAGATKFMITKQTKNKVYEVSQTHGYEVDLVGARQDKLVLASVKSFFGSNGVKPKEVMGQGSESGNKGYKMLNDVWLREELVRQACAQYGYTPDQVEFRLYAGLFAGKDGEATVRDWCNTQIVGGGPIQVVGLQDVVSAVQLLAQSKTYRDNPALVAVKVLNAAAEQKEKQNKKVQLSKSQETGGVTESFPIGSRVRSLNDGFVGQVFGYSNQGTKTPYVKVRNAEINLVVIRSAATLVIE